MGFCALSASLYSLLEVVGHMSWLVGSFQWIQIAGSASASGTDPSHNKSELPILWGWHGCSTGTSIWGGWHCQWGDQSLGSKCDIILQLAAYPLWTQPPGSVSIWHCFRCPGQNAWYILLDPTQCVLSGWSLDWGLSSTSVWHIRSFSFLQP